MRETPLRNPGWTHLYSKGKHSPVNFLSLRWCNFISWKTVPSFIIIWTALWKQVILKHVKLLTRLHQLYMYIGLTIHNLRSALCSHVARTGPTVMIPLSQPPQHRDYRHVPPSAFLVILSVMFCGCLRKWFICTQEWFESSSFPREKTSRMGWKLTRWRCYFPEMNWLSVFGRLCMEISRPSKWCSSHFHFQS